MRWLLISLGITLIVGGTAAADALPKVEVWKNPTCGCTRGFAGLNSHRATTTARVVERPDLTIEALSQLLATSLHDGGWLDSADPGAELVSCLASEIVELANHYGPFGPGAIIEREGDDVLHRADMRAA